MFIVLIISDYNYNIYMIIKTIDLIYIVTCFIFVPEK